MKYYAKTHTGAPRVGFITRGEVLTKAQEEALGEERLRDMVERGTLGVMNDTEPERKAEKPAEKPAKEPEPEQPEDGGETEEEEEELPELGDADDLISEAKEEPAPEKPAEKTTKSSGRRK